MMDMYTPGYGQLSPEQLQQLQMAQQQDQYSPGVGVDMSLYANNYEPQFLSPSPGGGGPMAMLGGGKEEPVMTTKAIKQSDIDSTGASIAGRANMTSNPNPSQSYNEAMGRQDVGAFMGFMR